MAKLFVYGTLRPGSRETISIPGSMYDLGWFPGITLGGPGCNSSFLAEIIEVDDARLAQIDEYEGYREDSPEGSLYLRESLTLTDDEGKTHSGWIYVYNGQVEGRPFVEHGNWLSYMDQLKGIRSDLTDAPKERAVR